MGFIPLDAAPSSDSGFTPLAEEDNKHTEQHSELPSHPGGEALVLPKMIWNATGGSAAQLARYAAERIAGRSHDEAYDIARKDDRFQLGSWGKEEEAAKEQFGKAYDWARNKAGEGQEFIQGIKSMLLHEDDKTRMLNAAEARTRGEMGFDTATAAVGGLIGGEGEGAKTKVEPTKVPEPGASITAEPPMPSASSGPLGADFGGLSDVERTGGKDQFGQPTTTPEGSTPMRMDQSDVALTPEGNHVLPIQDKGTIPYVPVEGLAAAQKPGFLRDANEVMQAREIDKMAKLNPTETYGTTGMDKLEDKQVFDYGRADPDTTKAVIERPVTPITADIANAAERKVAARMDGAEMIPLSLARELRSHDRLTDPKGTDQFLDMEQKVMDKGLTEPLQFTYSIVDNKLVQTNGHTRVAAALKHGLTEIPAKINVIKDSFTDHEEIRTAMDVPKTPDIKPGQTTVSFKELGYQDVRKPDMRAGLKPNKPKLQGFGKSGRMGGNQIGAIGDLTARPQELGLVPKEEPIKDAAEKSVAAKGMVRTIVDAAKQFTGIGHRDLADVVTNDPEFKDVSAIKDITERFNYAANVLIDRTVSILSERGGASGKLIKWVTDRREMIDNKTELLIEDALKGKMFSSGDALWKRVASRGFEHRIWGKDGALSKWRNTPHPEISEMMKTWWDSVGKDVTPEFRTENQKEIFNSVQKQFDKALAYVNDLRAAKGLAPIQKTPNFFPGMRLGDYRIVVKDGAGKVVGYFARNNMFEAQFLAKKLKEATPDLEVSDPYHTRTSQYDVADMEMFEEALRVMKGDDPATQALQRAYSELVGKKGLMRHSLQRTGTLGALGMEAGKTGAKSAERAVEFYIKKAYNYAGNVQKMDIIKNMADMPLEIRQKLPQAIDYSRDYITSGMSKSPLGGENFETEFAKFLGKEFGLGEGAAQRGINTINAFLHIYWLGTGKFITAQIPQSLNAVAKVMHLWQTTPQFRNPVYAVWKGISNTLAPDAASLEAVNWASQNGHLAPAIVELIRTRLGDHLSRPGELARSITSFTLGAIEREIVRTPAFLMFEHGLRDSMPDKMERFQTAANLMQYYMVHYDKASAPMIYQKAGIVGDTIRPMKQYSHNMFGQFFEYLQIAKDEKNIVPLATLVGTQVLVGGLRGMVMVAEAGVVINLVNLMLQNANVQQRIPTPDEMIIKWGSDGWKKAAAYGIPSTMTGQDMSHTVGAPDMPSMFSAPTIEFVGKPLMDAGIWFMHYIGGTDTTADEMRTMKDMSPNLMKAWVEQLFIPHGAPTTLQNFFAGPEGALVPNPNAKMEGNYRRSTSEWAWDKWFGGRSIDESQTQSLARYMKQNLQFIANERLSAIDAIADRIIYGKSIEPDLLSSYVVQGGSPDQLMKDLESAITRHSLDFFTQQMNIRNVNPSQARKLDAMRSYLDALPAIKQKTVEPQSGFTPLEPEKPTVDPMQYNPEKSKAPLTSSQQQMLQQLNSKGMGEDVLDKAAKLRALEAYGRPQIMDQHIQVLTQKLQTKGLDTMTRATLRNEISLWQRAKAKFSGITGGVTSEQVTPQSDTEGGEQNMFDQHGQKVPTTVNDAEGSKQLWEQNMNKHIETPTEPNGYWRPKGGNSFGNLPGAGVPVPQATRRPAVPQDWKQRQQLQDYLDREKLKRQT